ncbi:tail fiber assembly protein, partial [Atlantibacter sp.]|uniref:tail fiber assembly protein n=1 Tax=Atlantibacter sp. TaxID=1903473 RepID=UPI0028AC7626
TLAAFSPARVRSTINSVDLPPPTPRQLIEQAEQNRLALKNEADIEIAWRQDAVDAGMATAEETAALEDWKKFRILVMRVDTTAPVWPPKPA